METIDWFLAPITLILVYIIASIYIRLNTKNKILRKYFMYAVHFKMLGALGVTLVYFYYYMGAGDTVFYWRKSVYIHSLINQYGLNGIKLIFPYAFPNDPLVTQYSLWIGASSKEYFSVVGWAAFFGFFTFKSYLEIAFLFSFLSLTGLWALYQVFYEEFPKRHKLLAYAILFVPSMIFWGSGLFKDTIVIGCVGWIVRATYMIFIKKRRILINVPILIISVKIAYIVKGYVVLSLVPLLLVWVILEYRSSIKSNFIRTSVTPFLIVLSVAGGYILMDQISKMGGRFDLSNMQQRAEDMVWWHTYSVEIYGEEGGGSHYSLGSADFSINGILKKITRRHKCDLIQTILLGSGEPRHDGFCH